MKKRVITISRQFGSRGHHRRGRGKPNWYPML